MSKGENLRRLVRINFIENDVAKTTYFDDDIRKDAAHYEKALIEVFPGARWVSMTRGVEPSGFCA